MDFPLRPELAQVAGRTSFASPTLMQYLTPVR